MNLSTDENNSEFKTQETTGAAYLAAEGFFEQLKSELKGITKVHDRLILTDQPLQKSYWAQNIWQNPIIIPIKSIKDGAQKLKAIQRNWNLYSFQLHRRAKLIQESLPYVSCSPIQFPSPPPKGKLGSWTLLDSNIILASPECSSVFPNGEVHFIEDKEGPPNRAYLKLQEALMAIGTLPQPGDFCLDFGGSPGGWAWVLQKLGATVLSVDRSPLDPKIANLPRVQFEKKDAFSFVPSYVKKTSNKVDWIFWDVICYPEKTFEWISKWVESDFCKNFIVTIKFQGNNDYKISEHFSKIPGSKLVHLYQNKHELTWMLTKDTI